MKSWTRNISSVTLACEKKEKFFFSEVFFIFRYYALLTLFEILLTEIENVEITWDKKII